MLSLRCLVSALTQTGEGGLLFRFASSVQSWGGEGGALQADVAVCGEHWPCPGRAARGLARSLHGHAAPPPSTASASHRSGLRKSSDRNRAGLPGVRGWLLWGCFPLAPPPASYLQWGWGGSSLEFLSPFVLRTTGGVFRPVNFSLALPQFKKISLRLLSGPSGQSPP